MDSNKFDALIGNLSRSSPRRGAVRLLSAAVALLAGSQAVATQAKGKGKGGGKGKKSDCPKKKCPRGQHRNKRTCACECTRTSCSGGMEFDVDQCRCKCPQGMRECRDGCVARDACCPGDPPCPEDAKGCCHAPELDVCTIDGCCRELDGMKACNDFCIDTNTHPNHCGNCNVACEGGENCVNGKCGGEETCPPMRQKCGDKCCEFGEECCGGVCAFQGTAICTNDGWCPTTEGHACGVSTTNSDGPCCRFSADESCCASILGDGTVDTYCCPGTHDQCAVGGCCPAGMKWKGDCEACCTNGVTGCNPCQVPFAGRG